MPRLMKACQKIMGRYRPRCGRRTILLWGDTDGPDAEKAIRPRSNTPPHEAPIFGEDGEREVTVTGREKLELVLRAAHVALPEETAVADGNARVVALPTCAAQIGLGVKNDVTRCR